MAVDGRSECGRARISRFQLRGQRLAGGDEVGGAVGVVWGALVGAALASLAAIGQALVRMHTMPARGWLVKT